MRSARARRFAALRSANLIREVELARSARTVSNGARIQCKMSRVMRAVERTLLPPTSTSPMLKLELRNASHVRTEALRATNTSRVHGL